MGRQKMKIRKNDTVQVLAGKDKGKRGVVVKVLPKKNSVVVSGINLVKKAQKKRSEQDQGGIIDIEAPIDVSNVALISKKLDRPVRVGYKIEAGKRVRYCHKTGEIL